MLCRLVIGGTARVEVGPGVGLDQARLIAAAGFRFLRRRDRPFGVLDPRRHLSPEACHAARIVGALSAD